MVFCKYLHFTGRAGRAENLFAIEHATDFKRFGYTEVRRKFGAFPKSPSILLRGVNKTDAYRTSLELLAVHLGYTDI